MADVEKSESERSSPEGRSLKGNGFAVPDKQESPQQLIEEAHSSLDQKQSPFYRELKDLLAKDGANLDLNDDEALDPFELSRLKRTGKSSALEEKLITDPGLQFEISRMNPNDGVGISGADVEELGGRELDHLLLKKGAKALLKHLSRADEQTLDNEGNLVKPDGKLSKAEIDELIKWPGLEKGERQAIMVALRHFQRQAKLAGKDPNELSISEDSLKKALEYEPKLPSLSIEGLDRHDNKTTEIKEKPQEVSLEQALAPYSGRSVGNWLKTERGEIPAMLETIAGITSQVQADKLITNLNELQERIKATQYPADKQQREQLLSHLNEQKQDCAKWQTIKKQLEKVWGFTLGGGESGDRTISDAEIARLKLLPNLKHLSVGTTVSDDQLAKLPELPQLFWLSMQSAKVGDKGVAYAIAACPNLTKLDINMTGSTDAALVDVAKLSSLTSLNIRSTKVTGVGIAALANLPLEELDLSFLNLEDSQLAPLAKLDKLQHLYLSSSRLENLRNLPPNLFSLNLRGAKIKGANISDTDLAQLPPLRSLARLDLESTGFRSPQAAQILKHPKLRELGLAETQITDAQIPELAKLQSLTHISLYDTAVTDAGLRKFPELPKLDTLGLLMSYEGGTKISDNAVSQLQSRLKKVNTNFQVTNERFGFK